MIIHPSESLAQHLAEQNVPKQDGYEVPDSEYLMAKGKFRYAHPTDTAEELQDRVDYFLIWHYFGVQANDGTRGAELQNAQKVGVLTEEFKQMNVRHAEHLPAIRDEVRATGDAIRKEVIAGAHGLGWKIQELQDSMKHGIATIRIELDAREVQRRESAAQLELSRTKSIAKAVYWTLGLLVSILVALVVLTAFAYKAHAQTGLDGIRVSASTVTQKQWMGGIAKLDFGANLTVDCVSTPGTCLIAGTGGAPPGSGITTLNGLIADPQTFAKVDDTNVTLTIGSVTSTHTFTLGWAGFLGKTRGGFGADMSGATFPSSGTYAITTDLPANTTATSHQFFTAYNSTTHAFTKAQPACADISDAGTYCSSAAALAQTIAATASNWIRSYDASTGLFTKSRPVCADLSDAGTLCTSSGPLTVTKTAVAGQPLLSYDSTTGAFTQGALTASNVGLGSVTNDAQTKAAIVPNTAPSAGQMLLGNAGGTAYAPVSMSQDCTIASTGVITCLKTNNVSFAGGATMSTTAGGDLSGTLPSPSLVSKYKIWTCETGLGDGLTAVTAGTYLQSFCYNTTGVTVTLTGVKCYTDNSGSSTLNAAGNTLGALLTGAVTCTSSFAAGTQSANVALTSTDYVKFTWVADGTSKQSTWVVTGTY